MKELRNIFFLIVLVAGLIFTIPAAAEMSKGMAHGKSGEGHHEMKYGKGGKKGHHAGHGPKHFFGSQWKDTLTDQQKNQADRMHLVLKKSLSVLEARLKVKKAELSNLVARDNSNKKTIHSKIDELLKLKGEIMRNKYDHMVEMRSMLSPEQRVSFDMGVLKKADRKSGRGHH